MKTITFYSYKGGVGRSLALSNIAKRLSEFGKKVCIIDFDLDAPGIDQKFSVYLDNESLKNGIVDYIYSYSNENKLPSNINDFVTNIDFGNKNFKNIALIPAGNTQSQSYWKKLAMINWGGMFYNKNSDGISFFLDLKEKIKNELSPDFLLIDSRTGITDIAGITMSILADEIVLLCANNKENRYGIKQVIKTISNPENNLKNIAPKFHVVLSRIPFIDKPNEKYKEQNAKKSILTDINQILKKSKRNQIDKILVLHSDPELEYEEKFKMGYDDHKIKSKSNPLSIDYLELFEELTRDVLTEEDIVRFNSIRKAEVLIEESRSKEDSLVKIKLLNEAIKLNPTSDEAFYELGLVHIKNENYLLAIENLEKAIELNGTSMAKVFLGVAMARTDDKMYIDKAISFFKEMLKEDDTDWSALRELGGIYEKLNKYELALKYYEKLISHYPDDSDYNTISNLYKKMKKYDLALDNIYKSLEINPQNQYSTGTLAELQGHMGNDREFYKNLELFFSFGTENIDFQRIISEDEIYKKYLNDIKFANILQKYNITIDSIVSK